MALLEHTRSDERSGRIMNANLAEYLVPVNADIGTVDVVIVPEDDPHVNEIGVKGIGEIGIVGAPPRSPTRSFMQRENASAICRSRPKSS
jgi:CO/xanthine dehydrogenase Mo-binding subunit